MAEKKICNKEVKVPATMCLNDRDYLLDVLESEKNMAVNLSIALNEASNEKLYGIIEEIADQVKALQRKLYNLAFQNGWYILEEISQKKMDEKYNSLMKKYDELNDCDAMGE